MLKLILTIVEMKLSVGVVESKAGIDVSVYRCAVKFTIKELANSRCGVGACF